MNDKFLNKLEEIITENQDLDPKESYTAYLFEKGINKAAQKFGEEAVEFADRERINLLLEKIKKVIQKPLYVQSQELY